MAQAHSSTDSIHLKAPGNQLYAKWSSDSRNLVYQSNQNGNWDIYLFNCQNGQSRALTTDTAEEQHPEWIPGKQAVVYDVGRGKKSQLYLLNIHTGKKKVLIRRKPIAREASFTPSRHLVAFSAWDSLSESWQIFTYDFVYNNLNQLSHNMGNSSYPVFTPNGKNIVYTLQSPDGTTSLHITNWYGANDKKIAKDLIGRACWAPTAWRLYAVWHNSGSGDDIRSFHQDGSGMEIFHSSSSLLCCPEISPDGKRVAFSKKTKKGFDIFIINMPVN